MRDKNKGFQQSAIITESLETFDLSLSKPFYLSLRDIKTTVSTCGITLLLYNLTNGTIIGVNTHFLSPQILNIDGNPISCIFYYFISKCFIPLKNIESMICIINDSMLTDFSIACTRNFFSVYKWN